MSAQNSNFEKNIKTIPMFGDIQGMMGKLKDAQEKVAATKLRMNTVLIDEKSTDGLLKITTPPAGAAPSPRWVVKDNRAPCRSGALAAMGC